MPPSIYECPMCGARSCKEIELNTFHCGLCDETFDIEEMGFDTTEQSEVTGVNEDDK